MKNDLTTRAGWISASLLLLAYFLVTQGFLTARGPIYQILNLVAALGLVYVGWKTRALWMIVLNGVWGVVGLHAILAH